MRMKLSGMCTGARSCHDVTGHTNLGPRATLGRWTFRNAAECSRRYLELILADVLFHLMQLLDGVAAPLLYGFAVLGDGVKMALHQTLQQCISATSGCE